MASKEKKRAVHQSHMLGSKIRHDLWTWHDMKLVDYELRLNEFVSYSGWHD